jgi:hypothetical protein
MFFARSSQVLEMEVLLVYYKVVIHFVILVVEKVWRITLVYQSIPHSYK